MEQGGLTMRGAYAIVAAAAVLIIVTAVAVWAVNNRREKAADERRADLYNEALIAKCTRPGGELDWGCYFGR